MRILHVLDHSLPLHSGYVFRTMGILQQQRRFGWQTAQLTSPKQGASGSDPESIDGWTFQRSTPPRGAMAGWPIVGEWAQMRATHRRLLRAIDAFQPDLLHAHSPVLNAWPALWAGRARRLPVVYEVRAFWEDAAVDHGTQFEGGPRYRATRWLEGLALKRADAVTTICEGLRQDIVARGIAGDRVTVVPNAVDPGRFDTLNAPDAELARSLGLEGATVLGFAGSFYAYEGLDLLLRALARLRTERDDVMALLVGGGPRDAGLRALAEDLGLGDAVRFTGRVHQDRVSDYLKLMDVLVFPRKSMRLTELVTPLKPLEAMIQGRLVLASDIGGHRELIADGRTGFLVSPDDVGALADGILRTVAQRDAWPAILEAARQFVETERCWSAVAERYRGVYARARQRHEAGAGGAGARTSPNPA